MCTNCCVFWSCAFMENMINPVCTSNQMDKIMLSASSLQKLFYNPYEMRTYDEVFQKLDLPKSIQILPVMVHIMPFKPDSDFGSCIHIDDIQKLKKNTSLIFTAKSHTTAYFIDDNRDFFVLTH